MLYQVVSATFGLMDTHAENWMPVRGSEPVPTFGFEYTVGLEHVNVNTARMLKLFREGLLNLRAIWLDIIGAGDLKEVERRYPGLEQIMIAWALGTPRDLMIEQLTRFARDVMPAFGS